LDQQAYREHFETEDEHWWFEGRRAVIWALLRANQIAGPLRLLDAGCGTGRNMIEFGSLGEVRGVDFSADAIAFCAQRGITGATQGTVEQMPFDDGSFDLLLATDVIEHLDDDVAALAELRRVAAPGARLVVTVPAYRWLWGAHDEAHHHKRRYTLTRLRSSLAAGGWRPLTATYFNTLLLAPIAAVRLLSHDGDAHRDLQRTPPALNRALRAPMLLEAALIERGARLPAGVSIGAVCERSG
jgi:SAM-dependent methyltransferase